MMQDGLLEHAKRQKMSVAAIITWGEPPYCFVVLVNMRSRQVYQRTYHPPGPRGAKMNRVE